MLFNLLSSFLFLLVCLFVFFFFSQTQTSVRDLCLLWKKNKSKFQDGFLMAHRKDVFAI
jgi:hypothetical protein